MDNNLAKKAYNFYQKGLFKKSATLYSKLVKKHPNDAKLHHLFGVSLMRSGYNELGLKHLKKSVKINPADFDAINHLGYAYQLANNLDKAIDCYNKGIALKPEDIQCKVNLAKVEKEKGEHQKVVNILEPLITKNIENIRVLDLLITAYYGLKEIKKAQETGLKTLIFRDEQMAIGGQDITIIKRDSLPLPSPETKHLNVISMGLWGDDPYYLNGAIQNVKRAVQFYSNWTVHVYHDDTVPKVTLDALKGNGSVLIKVKAQNAISGKTFWRFRPVEDKNLHRVLVRDADCIFGSKEVAAVDEWVKSGKSFHVMRDHICNNELILAGLWGAICGTTTGFMESSKPYQSPLKTRWADQDFLRTELWPNIKGDVLIHDSYYSLFGAKPFPEFIKTEGDPIFIGMGIAK